MAVKQDLPVLFEAYAQAANCIFVGGATSIPPIRTSRTLVVKRVKDLSDIHNFPLVRVGAVIWREEDLEKSADRPYFVGEFEGVAIEDKFARTSPIKSHILHERIGIWAFWLGLEMS